MSYHQGLSNLLFEPTDSFHRPFPPRKKESTVCPLPRTSTLSIFADASKGDNVLPAGTEDYIHIKIQQKKAGRPLLLSKGSLLIMIKRKLVKAFKQKLACNGTVIEHPENGEVIQLQGDQHKNTCQLLAETGLAS